MAAASGLDKFRFVDDLAKIEAETNGTAETQTDRKPNGSPPDTPEANASAAAAAAAAAASRLLSLQRDFGGSTGSPMDFLRQLEASSRNCGGFDRLVSLAGFNFPGLTGLPPLTPINPSSDGEDLTTEPSSGFDTTKDHSDTRCTPDLKRGTLIFQIVNRLLLNL